MAGFSYENRYGIKELGTRTAGFIVPSGSASFSAAWSSFGYPDFRRDIAGAGCGLKLSEKLAAGIQVDYCSEKTPGEYSNEQCITFEAGLAVFPTRDITAGIHIFNPLPDKFRKRSQPVILRAGAGINLSSILFAGLETEMSTDKNLMLKTGFEYEAVKNLWLRAGYSTYYNSFSFGSGYMYGIIKLDIGFSTHEILGITCTASVIFKIR